jgi:hypothetical protein
MTQEVVLLKLAKYLEVIYPTKKVQDAKALTKTLQDLARQPSLVDIARFHLLTQKPTQGYPEYEDSALAWAELKKRLQTDGFCFGLSVSRGGMKELNKTKWWLHALVTVAQWNEQPHSLQTYVHLVDSDSKGGEKLKTIFDRVLHYIVIHQAITMRHPINNPFDLYQSIILKPDARDTKILDAKSNVVDIKRSYMGLVRQDGKIESVKYHAALAGNFTKEQMSQLFDEKIFPGRMCLIHNRSHVTHLDYEFDEWVHYDPNYSHKSLDTIEMRTKKKVKVIDEIISIHGNAIAMEYVSFKDEKIVFPYYEDMVENSANQLIDASGLFMIAKYCPDVLLKIIKQAIPQTVKAKQLKNTLAKSILATINGEICFRNIAIYASEACSELIKLIDESVEGIALLGAITKALIKVSATNQIMLHTIILFVPQAMEYLIKKINQPIQGKILLKTITESLLIKNDSGNAVLYMMAQSTPAALNELINYIDHTPEGRALLRAVTQGLLSVSARTWRCSALYICIDKEPKIFERLITHMDQSIDGEQLIQAVAKGLPLEAASLYSAERDTTFARMIFKCDPKVLLRLISISKEAPADIAQSCCLFSAKQPSNRHMLRDTLIRCLNQKNAQGRDGLELFRLRTLQAPQLFAEVEGFCRLKPPAGFVFGLGALLYREPDVSIPQVRL